jgi:tetratricopeptide (TPR) repeat protein
MHSPTDDGLRTRAGALADAGEWPALYELLRGEDRPRLLSHPATAYRFAESLYHTGRMEELASFSAAYEHASRLAANPNGVMRALNLGGIASFELGEPEFARARFDALMELAEANGDTDMLARAANNLGAIANLKGRRNEALAYYRLAIPLYQRLGQPRGIAQTYHNLGLSYRDMDRLDESIASYDRAIAAATELSYTPLVAMSTVGRAEAELRRGDTRLANQLAERGVQLAREVSDPISLAEALRVRGLVHCAEGQQAEGLSAFREAIDLARETQNTLLEAEIGRDMGFELMRAGQTDEALGYLRSALERFDALGAAAEARVLTEKLDAVGGRG